MTPFSAESRREIGRRDRWTCDCGRSFQDGWMVHASHYDHERDENYDNPENGCIACISCHICRHIELHQEFDDHWSFNSLRLLAGNALYNGMRKRECTTEDTLAEDREEIESIFNNYGLDINAFV